MSWRQGSCPAPVAVPPCLGMPRRHPDRSTRTRTGRFTLWSAGGTSASVEEPARPLTAARHHTRPTGTACSRSPNRHSSARPSASNVSAPTPPVVPTERNTPATVPSGAVAAARNPAPAGLPEWHAVCGRRMRSSSTGHATKATLTATTPTRTTSSTACSADAVRRTPSCALRPASARLFAASPAERSRVASALPIRGRLSTESPAERSRSLIPVPAASARPLRWRH